MSAPVKWWCSGCGEPLHLSNTLWKSADGDYLCNASGGDVIAEQYAAAGIGTGSHRERIMHRPANDWVHPALRDNLAESAEAGSARFVEHVAGACPPPCSFCKAPRLVRWIVHCDREGCAAFLIVPSTNDGGPDDKWSAGVYVSDSGWDARPNSRLTYCPAHHR